MTVLQNTTDAQFAKDVYANPRPVLVDFWAPWCGPCRMLGPMVQALAQNLAGRVDVIKCNIDDHPQTPAALGIRGIPTLMLFDQGALVATQVGVKPLAELQAWVESSLKKTPS